MPVWLGSWVVRTFLIGGGRQASEVHEAFVAAAGGPVVAFVLDGEDLDVARWQTVLTEAGAPEVTVVVVSPRRPPTPEDVAGAAGVYVAGGHTPGYRDTLVGAGTGWLAAARAANAVYAGFSAGAAIAASQALVGGWRTRFRDRTVEICPEDCAEDLDPLTVARGLGLVDVLVDVHAAQWGTHYRLVHAVLAAGRGEGWAIDENTALDVEGDRVTVRGVGTATRVRHSGSHAEVSVHIAGDVVALDPGR